MNPPTQKPCGLLRRFMAIAYDSVLLFSVLFFATALLMPITRQAISSGNIFYQLYLLLWSFLYFTWPWVKAGQTLGMRSWRIRLVSRNGGQLTLRQVSTRFLLAILSWLPVGAGYLWAMIDRDGLAFHDHLSGTRLVVESRGKRVSMSPDQ